MPLTPNRHAPGPRRRTLLAGALGTAGLGGLGLTAGCTSGDGDSADEARKAAVRRTRLRAARESEALLARYDGTVAAHAALAGKLRPLRDAVARHAQLLRSTSPDTGTPSP
ncbi:hypothetical protein G5C65_24105, partial [Streptomyces sp. SB3404]|nr:hypothetical protein [Streptomyces boncukensis]